MIPLSLIPHNRLDEAIEALLEDQQIFKHLDSILVSQICSVTGVIQDRLHVDHMSIISESRAAEGVREFIIHSTVIRMA